MKTCTVQTPIGEITAFENDSFGKELKNLGKYIEQEILDNNLRPIIEKSNFILDVGAHVGYHSIAYCRYNPNATIMAFEAQSQIFSILRDNIQANKLGERIIPYNICMGDKIRTTSLSNNITDGPNAGSILEYGTENEFNMGGLSLGIGGETVEMITIDSLNLKELDFLKIDVEGAEILVLMGAIETIKRYKPIICFESNQKRLSYEYIHSLGYESLPTSFDFLRNYGYTSFESIKYENFIARCTFNEIGITFQGYPIVSIGDTLGLTPAIEEMYHKGKTNIVVSTVLPELFLNNPYVSGTNKNYNPEINLSPCLTYGCSIVNQYANQLNLDISRSPKPRMYLSSNEIEYAKNELREFEGFKKIAISLKSSNDAKDLNYEFIIPLLDRLKRDGYKLIGVGTDKYTSEYYKYDKSFINATTIRQASSIIKLCNLYLGIDAGLYHVSASLDIPQVIFFRNNGACNNRYNDTYYIDSKVKCPPECMEMHLISCKHNNRCMDNFDLDEYYELIIKILPK